MSDILQGRTVLVTGGAGGIGRAISRCLAAAGARVLVICRDEAKARDTMEAIAADGGEARYILTDLADEDARNRTLEQLLSEEKIDILINNAGISGFMGPVSETPLEELTRVLDVNLSAPFHLSQRLLPPMEERGYGRIVNISSVAPRVNPAFSVTYNMSKAGLDSFTRSLSREVAARGITVNGVAPGLVLTDRIRDKRLPGLAAETGRTVEELLESMKSRSDTNSLTTEEELARTVLFLCSPAARNISGEIIEVSGGFRG